MPTFVLNPDSNRQHVAANACRAIMQADPTKRWRVTVEPFKESRSLAQCAYLNGVAYAIIGHAIGYERDEISEYLCGERFGWRDVTLPNGKTITRPLRTTTTDEEGKRAVLSKAEFADYVAFVQRFAAGYGLEIPDPMPENMR